MAYPNQLMKMALTSMLFIGICGHTEVYKSITPDGRVVYTDNADAAFTASQDASKIMVLDKLDSLKPSQPTANNQATAVTSLPIQSASIIISNPEAPTTLPNATPINPSEQSSQTTAFTASRVNPSKQGDYRLTIESPTVDMAYRKPAQPINIKINLLPSLRKGDRIVYEINGKHVATTQNTTYQVSTQDYLPDQYTLNVKIENIVGEVIASQTRSFYILQNNFVLQKQRKAADEAKATYDKLPWYKKLKVNINL